MGERIPIAVPRKGRPLETVLDWLARRLDVTELADDVSSTLRHEKAITKGRIEPESAADRYERLAAYSDVDEPTSPEYTLVRDERVGKPRRIVFDSVSIPLEDVDGVADGTEILLVGREEPFRALRTHEFALGFDSADLVLEEVVTLEREPLERIADINARIDPADTDVGVVAGLGDTVYHTLLATPDRAPPSAPVDRTFIDRYEGPLCITARYERLVQAVLGTAALDGVDFRYPDPTIEEERAIVNAGVGIYLTATGSTARDHGLVLGEKLFPSETVLLENAAEVTPEIKALQSVLVGSGPSSETALDVSPTTLE